MSTDSEIIRRSIGEPEAFSGLFDRHARAVGAFAYRRVGDAAGEDVLSESFLVAFQRRGSFDLQRESALPWLLGITSMVARRHRVAEARQWRAFEASAARGVHAADAGLDDLHDRLDAQAVMPVLARRIAALTARDRETLLLYAWGELTYEEIADALGVPVGTVRSRLNRVRRRLDPSRRRRSIENQEGDENGTVAAHA